MRAIEASSLTGRAAAILREAVQSGALQPGSLTREADLARQLGTSKTPVREALIRLEREGLVEILPRRGVRVRPLDPAEEADLRAAVTALEGLPVTEGNPILSEVLAGLRARLRRYEPNPQRNST